MLSAVLFDLDGTLADTDPIHFEIWQRLLLPHGFTVDQRFYDRHISGRLNQNILADLLPQLPEAEVQQFSRDKEATFRNLAAARLCRLPGLDAWLARLQAKQMPQGLVTNAPRANAEFMLRVLNLEHAFKPIVFGEELPRGKPDPLPYTTALEQLQLPPEQALVFEDSPTGVRSAVAAGIPTVGITSSHSAQTLEALGAKFAIADFNDLRLLALAA